MLPFGLYVISPYPSKPKTVRWADPPKNHKTLSREPRRQLPNLTLDGTCSRFSALRTCWDKLCPSRDQLPFLGISCSAFKKAWEGGKMTSFCRRASCSLLFFVF